jgi:hypothetical protein
MPLCFQTLVGSELTMPVCCPLGDIQRLEDGAHVRDEGLEIIY